MIFDICFVDNVQKVSDEVSDNNYNFTKSNLIDGSYSDDGCCIQWEHDKVTLKLNKKCSSKITLILKLYVTII